jgi:uncharacterized protein (DUF1697 family)
MPVIVSMLKGVNLGAHNRMKMDALRDVYESLGFKDVQTYVQSGNVVFKAPVRDIARLPKKIGTAIEAKFGFCPEVILRTTAELRVARNPFVKQAGTEPSRLLVDFLASEPAAEAVEKVRKMDTAPEEVRISGRELYIYFPNGMARPKIGWAAIEKVLKVPGTGRNWNSVTKLLEMAEKLEG